MLIDFEARSEFEVALLHHTKLCIGFMIAQKFFWVLMILGLLYFGQAESGLYKKALDTCSGVIVADGDIVKTLAEDPCIICFGEFEEKEELRQLNECWHVFHKACIDEWLLLRRPRGIGASSAGIKCPVCSTPICTNIAGRIRDPKVARDVAWLAQLQRM